MSIFKNNRDPDTDTSHLSENLGKHASKAFTSVAFAQIISNVIGLGGTIILARMLGPEEFGLMAMLATAVALLMVFESFGLYYATIQKKQLSSDELNFLFWANLGIASVIGVILFSLSGFIAVFFEEPELEPLSQILALAFLFRGGANQHAALLNRKLQHDKSSIATVLGVTSATVGAIILAYYGYGVWALVWRQVIEAVTRALALWFFTGWIPRLVKYKKEYLSSFSFGASMTSANLMYYLSRNSDDILIGKFIGATSLGFYKLSYQILLLPLRRINEPISQVMVPILSQLQEDAEKYKSAYFKAAHVIIFMQLPVGLIFAFHSEALIQILFGNEWLPASTTLSWLASVLMIQALSNTTGWLLISQRRSKEIFYWSMFSSVVTVSSFIIGLPHGIAGVAAAYTISSYLKTPLLIYICGRKGPVGQKDFYGIIFVHILPALTFSAMNYLAVIYLTSEDLVFNFFMICGCGLMFIPCVLIFPNSRKYLIEGIIFVKNRVLKKKKVTV